MHLWTQNTKGIKEKENTLTDLSWGEKPSSPRFNLFNTHIKTGANNPTFVQSTIQFNHDFTSPVVINILKLSNVTYTTNHRTQQQFKTQTKLRNEK